MGEERNLDGHLARAGILANAGALSAAEAEYRAALALDPGCREAREGLGAVLLGDSRPDEAETEFRLAVQTGSTAALPGLALALRARGAEGEARVLLEGAIAGGAADPLCYEVLNELAGARGLPPEIEATGLRFTYGEEHLAFRCQRCGHGWDQPAPSAMCLLTVRCPGCDLSGRLDPEAAIMLVERLEPPMEPAAADALDQRLADVVGHWHRDPALAPLLTVGDINVGECAEHEVMALMLDAALATRSGGAP